MNTRRASAVTIAGLFVGLSSGFVHAKQVVWTGGAGVNGEGRYEWWDDRNWEGGRPSVGDTPVFRHTGEIAIDTKAQDGYVYRFNGMRFEGVGSTTRFTRTSYVYLYGLVDQEVYVAEGATASFANVLLETNTGTGCRLLKTGSGTLESWFFGCDNVFAAVDVEGGVLRGLLTDSSWYGLNATSLVVRAGARIETPNGAYVKRKPSVLVEDGGELRLGGDTSIGTLSGGGKVFDLAGSDYSNTLLTVYPGSDSVFSGELHMRLTISTEAPTAGRFIVGAANTLAKCYRVTGSRYLGFAPGVTDMFLVATWGENYVPDAGWPLVLEATDGTPISVCIHAQPDTSTLSTSGCGNLYIRGESRTFRGNAFRHTGLIGCAEAGITLTLGDGTAANDFDFSFVGGIDAKAGTVAVANVSSMRFDGKVTGAGAVKFRQDAVLGDLSMSGGTLYTTADLTMNGGDNVKQFQPIFFETAGKSFTLNGGRLGRTPSADAWSGTLDRLLSPDGMVWEGENAFSTEVTVAGGEMYMGIYTLNGPKRVTVAGGKAVVCDEQACPQAATAENPAVFLLDGGDAYVRFKSSNGGYVTQVSPFPGSAAYQVAVGSRGGSFRQTGLMNGYYARQVVFKRPVVTAAGVARDGGFGHYGYAETVYQQPFAINGTFRNVGGYVRIPSTAALPAENGYFGSGDVELANGLLQLDDRAATDTELKLASAPGSCLRYVGGNMLRIRNAGAAQSVRIGGLMRQPGGVLFLADAKALGASDASAVRVANGMATKQGNGRVLQPVLGVSDGRAYLLGYDATKGFARVEPTVSDFAQSTPEDIVAYGKDWSRVSTTVAMDALILSSGTGLEIGNGGKLAVGDGTNPAVVIADGAYVVAAGTGHVDFGSSEGVIVHSAKGSTALKMPIRGSNGLTVVGCPTPGNETAKDMSSVTLSGDSTYAGGTRIGAVRVVAEGASCFSTGCVTVGDGERFGGEVRFNVADGRWKNDFRIAGWGMRDTVYNDSFNNGALSFAQNATLSGSVELTALARVSAKTGVCGDLAGTVSGDRLQVFDSPGVIRLSGDNTYTGGTEVVSGTLEIAKGTGVGTGAVVLNGGTLRFVNDGPIVFANDVSGVGTVVFAGTAPVTLTGATFASLPFRSLGAGTVLDLATPANNVYAPVFSGTTDLGGKVWSCANVYGSGMVQNGTLVVTDAIEPAGTLSFAAGVLTADGATFVCVMADGKAGRLSFGGDFDLSTLALQVLRGEGAKPVNPEIVSAGGTLSGAFSSVALPKKSWSVVYGGSSVRVDNCPGMTIMLR